MTSKRTVTRVTLKHGGGSYDVVGSVQDIADAIKAGGHLQCDLAGGGQVLVDVEVIEVAATVPDDA